MIISITFSPISSISWSMCCPNSYYVLSYIHTSTPGLPHHKVRIADTSSHKASISACDVRAMIAGLTYNNMRRSHRRCVQNLALCPVQAVLYSISRARSVEFGGTTWRRAQQTGEEWRMKTERTTGEVGWRRCYIAMSLSTTLIFLSCDTFLL
jgi:hypothetical protein